MAGQAKPYKRSWRNLLINKRYQLRFTLFMVGMSTLLMIGLGAWVMKVAASSHAVASNNLFGAMDVECKDPSEVVLPAAPAPAASPAPIAPAAVAPAAPAAPEEADAERPHSKAVVTTEEMILTPPPPAAAPVAPAAPPPIDPAALARFEACKARYAADVAELGRRKDQIVYALIATGALLVLGLTIYGIKMTHKVAGPLYKVSLYLDKLKAGTYEPVHSLRKGDHLAEFYDHFKLAHAGARKMQEDDVARLRAAIEAADAAGLASKSPELAAALDELRVLVAQKEKSLV